MHAMHVRTVKLPPPPDRLHAHRAKPAEFPTQPTHDVNSVPAGLLPTPTPIHAKHVRLVMFPVPTRLHAPHATPARLPGLTVASLTAHNARCVAPGLMPTPSLMNAKYVRSVKLHPIPDKLHAPHAPPAKLPTQEFSTPSSQHNALSAPPGNIPTLSPPARHVRMVKLPPTADKFHARHVPPDKFPTTITLNAPHVPAGLFITPKPTHVFHVRRVKPPPPDSPHVPNVRPDKFPETVFHANHAPKDKVPVRNKTAARHVNSVRR